MAGPLFRTPFVTVLAHVPGERARKDRANPPPQKQSVRTVTFIRFHRPAHELSNIFYYGFCADGPGISHSHTATFPGSISHHAPLLPLVAGLLVVVFRTGEGRGV
jgi:hypothetical protein